MIGMVRGVTHVAGRRRMFAVVALGVLAVALSACIGPAGELGTSDSPCYRALPAARADVQNAGKLLGVRFVTPAQVDAGLRHTHQMSAQLAADIHALKSGVCAVGYSGTFKAGDLVRPWPPDTATSRHVLVLIEQKNAHVLVTLLLTREPIRLSQIS